MPDSRGGDVPPSLIVVPEAGGAGAPVQEGVEVEAASNETDERNETVEQPSKVLRIGTMIRQLLDEVRQAPLDDASRSRLKDIYETSVRELSSSLSPDLASELKRLTSPFDSGVPSDSELRVAQAQLVGWLEGLFHGIQATLFAQQLAARQQLEQMSRAGLPPGQERRPEGPQDRSAISGTYL